ncbi:hypothetical protein IIA15_00300 [candidate division TA06 bacterium]|nr:hypothetical protein [candidate division TA06 bacterium]
MRKLKSEPARRKEALSERIGKIIRKRLGSSILVKQLEELIEGSADTSTRREIETQIKNMKASLEDDKFEIKQLRGILKKILVREGIKKEGSEAVEIAEEIFS